MKRFKVTKKTMLFLGGILLIAIFAVLITFFVTREDPIVVEVNDVTVELGEELNYDLLGVNDLLEGITVDESGVNYLVAGIYEGTVIFDNVSYPFTVIVEDTVAPVLTVLLTEIIVLEPNEELSIQDIAEASDLSGEVLLTVEDTTYESDGVLCFSEIGLYTNIIVATDASGNESKENLSFFVGTEPVISGADDHTITVGDEIDLLEGITAIDSQENDLTELIEVDSTELNSEAPGAYTITYIVVDEYGFKAVVTRTITVEEKEIVEDSSNSSSSSSSGSSSSSSSSSSNSSSGSSSSSSSSSSNSSSDSSSSSSSSSDDSSSSTSSSSSDNSSSSSSDTSSEESDASSSSSSSTEESDASSSSSDEEYKLIATYSSSDLVSMGFIPSGTGEGSTVTIWTEGGYGYVKVSFKGEKVPSSWSTSATLAGDTFLSGKALECFKVGSSGTFWYTASLNIG